MPKKSARVSRSPCRQYLSKKIAINMKEYKEGVYASPKQAIAVSYSQVKKLYPHCKKELSKNVKNVKKVKKSNRRSRRK